MTRTALYLQDAHPIMDGVEYTRYAEARGFEAVWQAESRLVREATVPMAAFAAVTDRIKVGSAAAVTTGVSVGYVVWLIRGGVLMSSVLSSLPAWRFVDPLPVLARGGAAFDDDGESLESIVSAGTTAFGAVSGGAPGAPDLAYGAA